MGKVIAPLTKSRSRWRSRSFGSSWQVLPSIGLGAILFAGISSSQIDGYLSVYLVLLAAQLGTVGIYLLMRSLKSRAGQNRL
jgi:hypothetical protein